MLQIGSVSAIPQVQAIRAQIVTAEADLAATQKRYGPLHPKNIQAATQIKQLRESLKETLEEMPERSWRRSINPLWTPKRN